MRHGKKPAHHERIVEELGSTTLECEDLIVLKVSSTRTNESTGEDLCAGTCKVEKGMDS